MSVIKLPAAFCDEFDRICRSFIWGESDGAKKIHLVTWDELCKPKECKGLGLTSTKEKNVVVLGKLGWRLFTDCHAL